MEKIKFTRVQKTAEAISAVFIIYLWTYLAVSWSGIPERIPSHYNAEGMIDAWGSTGSLISIAAAGTFLYFVLTAVSLFPKLWNIPVKVTEANRFAVYRSARNLLCFLKVLLTAMFTYMIVCMVNASPLGFWLMPAALLSILGTIVYSLIAIIISARSER